MTVRNTVIAIALAFVGLLPFLGILPGWTPPLATVTAFMALSLIGLNLIFGVTGMLALGQAAFVALPGYAAGLLHATFGVPLIAAIPAGVAVAVLIARLVAEIFIRLPGIYFAIGTLGFAFVVEGLARAFPAYTGGASGLVLEAPVNLTRNQWYIFSVFALGMALLTFAWLVRGRFLRTLRLVRHDELAAQVLGVDVVNVKARVFTIGSAYSAVGGILLSYYIGVLAPESGGVNASLEALAMLVIGGAGTLFGPFIGAAAIQWLFAISGEAKRYELLVYGLGFFLVVLYAPTGISGLLRRAWSFAGARGGQPVQSDRRSMCSCPKADSPKPPARSVMREGVCLHVQTVAKHFGGLKAVQDVSFEVSFGQIVALIGPNGAGKSTLFNLVSGIEIPTHGRVLLEGNDLAGVSIHERAASIGRSFQVPRLVPDLTALGNVLARLDHVPGQRNELNDTQAARAQLEAFELGNFSDIPASRIGLGHHKLIEIVRAAVGQPALLLLDEPAVGLTPEEVTRLAELLRKLKSQGAAILVVEHNVGFVSTVADDVVVMETGKLIARGSPETVMSDQKVRDAYLGALA